MKRNKPSITRARPMYVEDEGSDGERVRGTRRKATLKKTSNKEYGGSRPSKKKPRNDSRYSSTTTNYVQSQANRTNVSENEDINIPSLSRSFVFSDGPFSPLIPPRQRRRRYEEDERCQVAETRKLRAFSGSDDDNLTDRDKEAATTKVSGSEIKYHEGTEIKTNRPESIRNVNERSSSREWFAIPTVMPLSESQTPGATAAAAAELLDDNAMLQAVWEEQTKNDGGKGFPHKKCAVLMKSRDENLENLETTKELDELETDSSKICNEPMEKKQYMAYPDSGSELNLISKSYASSQGFIIRQEPRDLKKKKILPNDARQHLSSCKIASPQVNPQQSCLPISNKDAYRQIPREIPRQQNARKVLRILIRKKQHLACPDSGSEQNIMSASFASSQGFIIRQEPRDLKQFELGNGKRVWSVGRVSVPLKLIKGLLRRKKRWFYVLSNCPVDIILGRPFLKEAEVLTKHRDMLETCPADIGAIPSFLWIGSPRHRTTCSLDGRVVSAVADTGSDLNLMSLECARRGKYQIDTRRDARRIVRVGDGSEVSTVGQVYVYNLSLDWREEETPAPPLLPGSLELKEPTAADRDSGDPFIIFHVMPGLSCDVILGADFLYNTDAFNKLPNLLGPPLPEPLESDKARLDARPYELKIMISVGFFFKRVNVTFRRQEVIQAAPVIEDERTMHRAAFERRLRARDMILDLPQDMQERARTAEEERLREYEREHQTCRYCHPL